MVEVALEDVLKKLRQHTKVRSHKNHAKVILHLNPRIYLRRFFLLIISITCGPTCPRAAAGRAGGQPGVGGAEEVAGRQV